MESTHTTTAGAFSLAERAWFDSYRSHHFDRAGRHVKRPGTPMMLIIWGRLAKRVGGALRGPVAPVRVALATR